MYVIQEEIVCNTRENLQCLLLCLPAECGGCEHSLALAVLYYVSPDPGFTLDILQWAPGSTALRVRLRLQLHELADLYSFLVGSIVLNMCTVPTHQSGESKVIALGGSSNIVMCIKQTGYCTVDVLSDGVDTGWQ